MELATEVDGLVLRPLRIGDVDRYVAVVQLNRVHLTSFGDYEELVGATKEQLEADLRTDAVGRFGVWLDGDLIGRVDLIPKDGTNAVLGYWLDRNRLHRGLATASCRSLIEYGKTTLGITDVWAGVTHGNQPSVQLLERLHFEFVADMGTYARFHLDLQRELGPTATADQTVVRPDFARMYGSKARVVEGQPIPDGAYGPIPVINGNGWAYRGGRGGGGLHESITGVRFSYASAVHPDGYVMYFSGGGDAAQPDFDDSWAAIYRQDPLRFEAAFTQRIEERLQAWTRVEHLSTAFVNDFPHTSLEIILGLPSVDRSLVFTTEIWRVVDWYEAFDPEMLLIDAFAFEFDLTMEDDLERAGFTLSHDDRLHVDIDRAPTAVAKSIVDPRA